MDYAKLWDTFCSYIKEPYWQGLILDGLKNTLQIALLGIVIGIIVGSVIAVIKVAPKYRFIMKFLDKVCTVYVAIFRGVPMVVQLLLAYYVLLPLFQVKGVDPLSVGIWVFGLNSGAYVSEIMRGGINSVDKGQLEAGRAVGLSYTTAMVKIVIPQAIKNIVPTLGNELITLVKETSVVQFIGVFDLYTVFFKIGTNTYSTFFPYIAMALIYVVLVLIITVLVRVTEWAFAKSDRNRKTKVRKKEN